MRDWNRPYQVQYLMFTMVGAEGFEPPTLCSQSRCATRLRYAPIFRLYRESVIFLKAGCLHRGANTASFAASARGCRVVLIRLNGARANASAR
jgi:hypothetical protein